MGDGSWAEFGDDLGIIGAIVLALVALVVIAFLALVLLNVVALAIELLIIAILVIGGIVGRVVFRRPWIVRRQIRRRCAPDAGRGLAGERPDDRRRRRPDRLRPARAPAGGPAMTG